MKDLMDRALNFAALRGAEYADIRVVDHREENLGVKNGTVETLKNTESTGFGVRVLSGGAWGFASSQEFNAEEVDQVTQQAIEIARASARVPGKGRGDLGPPVTSQGTYRTPIEIDPFSISLEEKLGLLLAADAEIAAEGAAAEKTNAHTGSLRVRKGNLAFIREDKWFANSEGAFTEQTIFESGAGIHATAIGGGEVQVRSYPASLGRQQQTTGWEGVLAWDLPGNGRRLAREAVALLTADPCPSGITADIILAGNQLSLQVHESCGHPIELDRVFGSEAAYAGTSFLTTEKLGSFRYGSEVVNLTAESIRPLGLGTFGWDDEGVPAQSTSIVRNGVFTGYLMSRETATQLGMESNGCMRASSWNRIPIIRMTNVSLEPGTWELEDLIADTDYGILMDTNRSWSIDDKRYNFQFGTEIGWEIKNGKLGRMLRNPTYTGLTPQFWNSCDAVCNEKHWTMWGTPNCGKGQPSQIAHTGHGAAPARFRNVKVGVLK